MSRIDSEDKRREFDLKLYEPRSGRELSPEHAQRLRESEMAAFDALARQQAGL